MALMLRFVIFLSMVINNNSGKTVSEWKSRVIYQLLTDRFSQSDVDPSEPCRDLRSWCNGTWKGIIGHLDYIQNLGVDAIWISPIVENTEGGYHGYWAKNLNRLNDHFGSKEDLLALVEECHRRDIWVMVDVVPNHMGYPMNCSYMECPEEYRNNFREFTPFNETIHYHEYCEITWPTTNQTELEVCRLAYLVDLNQTVPFVRQNLYDWIRNLTLEYGFDGYRVDTVRHIEMGFWPGYQQSAGAYCVGEVANSESVEYLASYQRSGLDAVLNFHLQYAIFQVFQMNASMTLLRDSIQEERANFPDVRSLGTFVDNHDMSRFLNITRDEVLFKNALTYIFYGEGIPIIYYGSEQGFSGGGDPNCRESLWPHYNEEHDLYKFIKKSLEFRRNLLSTVISTTQEEIYADDDTLVFTKGINQIIVVVTNLGTGSSQQKSFAVAQQDGTEYENIHDSSDVVIVRNGHLTIEINNGQPKVYFIRGPMRNAAATQDCTSAFLFASSLVLLIVGKSRHYKHFLPRCTVSS